MTGTSTTPSPVTADLTPGEPFPEIDLRQLRMLTDDTGLFQHAQWAVPDPHHGYCIDDNARALIAALLHAELRGYDERVIPLQRYLAFFVYAFNEDTDRFRNFMAYDRRWLEPVGSQDSQGRTLWALGLTVKLAPQDTIRGLARSLFYKALPGAETFQFLRSRAFAILGLGAFLVHEHDPAARALHDRYAHALLQHFHDHARDDWPWWEDTATYDNAKLSHAMLAAGRLLQRPDMIDVGLRSLNWLLDVQTAPQGHLSIIGNDGWLQRGKPKAPFDQQPLEAYAMVDACLRAAQITGESVWADHAWRCFEWFRGHNDLHVPLYHPDTGGCQDGLNANGPNANQGAESTLAYLLSVLELHRYHAGHAARARATTPRTLGLGIVGAGAFARFALPSYQPIDDLQPLAVWNRTPERAHAFAQDHHLHAVDTLDDLLADPRIHLVYVSTIPDQHRDHALAALNRGKHVLCEKPLATDPVDAQTLLQAAAERDCVLAANHVTRYGPLAEPVRQLIASGALGTMLRGTVINHAGTNDLPPDHWFWDETRSGGIFVEHGVHFFDLLQYWLGQGHVLHAARFRRPQPPPVDQVECIVQYGPRTSVSFYHGFHQPAAMDCQEIQLLFEAGYLNLAGWIAGRVHLEAVIDEAAYARLQNIFPDANCQILDHFDDEAHMIRRRPPAKSSNLKVRLRWASEHTGQALYQQALRAVMEDVIATIRHRSHRPRMTAEHARDALELAVNADRLAKGWTP